MSTLVMRGEEVKLKCNYYISVREGEEHREPVWFRDKWGW